MECLIKELKKRRKSSNSKPVKIPFYKKAWFILIVGILVGIVISPIINKFLPINNKEAEVSIKKEVNKNQSDNSTDESQTQVEDVFVKKASDASFDGSILKGNTYSIRITDHKVIQSGEDGNERGENPIIVFYYDTIVSSDYKDDKAISPGSMWMLNFKVIQDNNKDKVNELKMAPAIDEETRESRSVEIKPGGTVSSTMAYELSDDKTPVKLVAESFGNNFGEFEYEVK